MSSKKKLKQKINKLRVETRLQYSDLLIEKEKLAYRAEIAEAQVRSLMRENFIMRQQITKEKETHARNGNETSGVPKVFSNGASINGTPENAGNPPSSSQIN